MDPKILALTKAIRKTETGTSTNPYSAKGASGEVGAYQFMPSTWKQWSKQYLGVENAPLTVENQNKVAYSHVKALKEKGYTPAQIASAWNSGDPNAYINNKKGVNKYGVQYDVPGYVAKVSANYRLLRPQTAEASTGSVPEASKPFTYNVPSLETRDQKIQRYQAEAAASQKEADKYKGFGLLKETAKEAGKMLIGSELGLGETIRKTFLNQKDTYSKEIENLSATQADLVRAIRRKDALGQDSTKLKQLYNENVKQLDELSKGLALENNLPTTKQAVGQLGGTALDLLSFGTYGKAATGLKSGRMGKALPSAVTAVTEPTKFISKSTAKAGAGGAALGYGYDVAQNLQEGRSDYATPGVGTALGAGLSVLGRAGSAASRGEDVRIAEIVDKRAQEIYGIETNYEKTRKALQYSKDENAASRKRVASTDVLVNAVNEDGKIETVGKGKAIDQYRAQTIDGAEDVVFKALEREGSSVAPSVAERKIAQAIDKSALPADEAETALKRARKALYAIQEKYGDRSGRIPLSAFQMEKIKQTKLTNFQTPPEKEALRKALGQAFKEIIEENSNLNIKGVNAELAKYYKDIELLRNLNGKRVKGGRLGKYFSTIAGNMVGGVAGNLIGGPGGAMAGVILGGETAAKIKGMSMASTFGKATGRKAEQSAILKEAKAQAESPRLALPAQTTPFKRVIPSGKPVVLPSSTPRNVNKSAKVVADAAGKNLVPQTENLLPAGKLPPGFKAPSEGQINLPARTQTTIDKAQSKSVGTLKTKYNTPTTNKKGVMSNSMKPSSSKTTKAERKNIEKLTDKEISNIGYTTPYGENITLKKARPGDIIIEGGDSRYIVKSRDKNGIDLIYYDYYGNTKLSKKIDSLLQETIELGEMNPDDLSRAAKNKFDKFVQSFPEEKLERIEFVSSKRAKAKLPKQSKK